jgi:hypothetical protein
MTVKELADRLNDIATLFGNLDVRFANRDISAPVLDVVFAEGSQFVTLNGGMSTSGDTVQVSVSDGLSVGEQLN